MHKIKYDDIVKSEKKFKERLAQLENEKIIVNDNVLEDTVQVEPDAIDYNDSISSINSLLPEDNEIEQSNDNIVNFSEFAQTQDELDAKTTDFISLKNSLRDELEKKLELLDEMKNRPEINFNDIEPEEFGIGGRAA